MPYTPQTAPAFVKAQLEGIKLRQWVDVWNSAHARCMAQGGSNTACEGRAFAQANAVAGVKRQAG